LRRLVKNEGGFGLVELLIAMTVMVIAITAIVAGFSSGMVAINRASRVSTAGTLADIQMEGYRKVRYAAIALAWTPSDTLYTVDSAYDTTWTIVATCAGDPGTPTYYYCNPSRKATGPDNREYRVDSYVTLTCAVGDLSTASPDSPTNPGCRDTSQPPPAPLTARPSKRVTVVVRDWATPTTVLFRESSTFDQATG
jgi:type II secretory pathway pseudopilin PulG